MPSLDQAPHGAVDNAGSSADETMASVGPDRGAAQGPGARPPSITVLRALRAGTMAAVVLLMLTAAYLAVASSTLLEDDRGGAGSPSGHLVSPVILPLLGAVAWMVAAGIRSLNRSAVVLASVVIAVSAAGVAARMLSLWWGAYQESGVSILRLLCGATAAPAIAAMLIIDLRLRFLRTGDRAGPPGGPDPARWFGPGVHASRASSAGLPRRHRPRPARARLAVVACLPALICLVLTATPHAVSRPATRTFPEATRLSAGDAPARPASIGTEVAWRTEVTGVTEVTEGLPVVAGKRGPLVISNEGITALSPADGAPLWTYQRAADYSTPVVSPDGEHLAVRIQGPRILERANDASPISDPLPLTLVLETRTGKVVLERYSAGGMLQLTDSAVLDGRTALSLDNGSELWRLEDHGSESPDPTLVGGCPYSGPAGHASFILDCVVPRSSTTKGSQRWAHATLTLVADSDPTAVTEASGVLVDTLSGEITVVEGWTGQSVETTPTTSAEAREADAVSLDSLAGIAGADRRTTALGRTSGLNHAASTASGMLVTQPLYDPEEDEAHVEPDQLGSQALAVIDPTRQSVTPIAQDAGLAGALMGIVPGDEQAGSAAIHLQAGDGTTTATIPLEEGPTASTSRSAGPTTLGAAALSTALTAVSTPGATILILDTDADAAQESITDSPAPRTVHIIALAGAGDS